MRTCIASTYVKRTTYVAHRKTVENSHKLPAKAHCSLRRYGRRAASGRPENPAWARKDMSWQQQQYGAGGGPPKKRFANLATGGHPQAQAQAAHSTNFQAPNQYQSNGTASSSVAKPYSVSLPMGTSNSHIVGSSAAGSAAPALAFPGTQVYPPPHQHMHAHMHQVNNNQHQHQSQQEAYLNNLLLQQQQQAQMQQMQQHHQQQIGLQLQLQIQQQEQQRRQEQIQLAALAHQAHQQQVHASIQAQQYQAHNNLQGVVAPAAVAAADNVPSPSKKRPFPTPVGEYRRSQSMPPDIGRERGAETNDDHDTSEDDEKLAAAEEEERKPAAPTATKPRKPPKPMPETMYKGIVKGGLTRDDIKDHKIDVAASKMEKSKGKVKKLDGRPPRAASSSSLRRASSLPVSKVDKKEQERRRGSPSASSEEEINLMDYLPRRRSRRGNAALSDLAEKIVDGNSVVVITGAGLSVGSGIRPFRGKEGLWSTVVWTKATREAFRDDPLDWYNSFWLPHFPPSTYEGNFHPNEGHEVISKLAALSFADVKVITQNVDGLHSSTKQEWEWSERLIEAHGRLGLYKCIPESDSDTDSDSDEEEDRPVKLGHRKKTRLLREAYYSYGDGAEGNNDEDTVDGDKSSGEEKTKFDEWDRKQKEDAEKKATFRPKVSLLGGSVYRGAVPTGDGSSSSSEDSSSSSSYDSAGVSEVPMKKTYDCSDERKKNDTSKTTNNDTPDSKSSKARSHNHVICRYELEESFSAAMIDGTERTRRIMLGEIPSDDDEDISSTNRRLASEESASDTGMSSGMGSETDTDADVAKPTKKGADNGGGRNLKRRKNRKGPKKAKLLEPPMCPECMIPCPPQALLFDEGYHAHDFYQFEKMEEWLSKADVVIFIGTSFKVTITDVALEHARDHGVPVYNFNVDGKGDGSLESSGRLDANNVIGDVGETLPQLWIAVQEEMGARGMFDEYGELK